MPAINGLSSLLAVYWQQVRDHPWRALLSISGIVAGVAMIFAVQVSSQSISSSIGELTRGVAGRGNYELVTDSPDGIAQSVYRRIAAVPGIESAPVLNLRATLRTEGDDRTVALVGIDRRLRQLGGSLIQSAHMKRGTPGLYLPSQLAQSLNIERGRRVEVEADGRTIPVHVADVLGDRQVGSLSTSYFAAAPLPLAQQLTGVGSRINHVFLAFGRGIDLARAQRQVLAAAGPGWRLRPTSAEEVVLDEAAKPDKRSLTLFGAVSLMVGLLLAFNAMLVAAVERRRDFAQLRMIGASDAALIVGLILEALIIGVLGSLLGIALGYWISTFFASTPPRYLVAAFDLGSQHVVTAKIVLISFAGGVLAALVAAAIPAANLLRVRGTFTLRRESASSVQSEQTKMPLATLLIGLALLAGTTIMLVGRPELGIVGIPPYVVGGALVFSHLIPHVVTLIQRAVDRWGTAIAGLSLAELVATPRRTTALASISAFAVFAVITVAGTTGNLERGLRQLMSDFSASSDLWISQPGADNDYMLREFDQNLVGRIAALPQVASARPYRATFLDWGNRRVWIGGPPADSGSPVTSSQIVKGNPGELKRRLRQGGWAALTWTLAENRQISIGDSFKLPTPTGPQRFRLAATITSHGWPGGAVMISGDDLRRAWKMSRVTAIQADLAAGVPFEQGARVVRRALGASSPLMVQSAKDRKAQLVNASHENLTRLYQIANIVLVAALVAVITAMLTALAQRGQRVSALRAVGMSTSQAFRALFAEIGVVLALGAVVGLCLGLPLQYLAGRWLATTTGHPVIFTLETGLLEKIAIAGVAVALLGAVVAARELMRSIAGRNLSPE